MADDGERLLLVAGLGNPGPTYAVTRHNVGFGVVEELRSRLGGPAAVRKFDGLLCDAWFDRRGRRRRVMLLRPMTYMNESGRSVGQWADFYKAERQDVLVVLDDMALALGRLRARPDGSAGGHNGLQDILTRLGGYDVPRLRIGIGPPPGGREWKDYVLSAFRPEERPEIELALKRAADAVEDWVFQGIQAVMDKYNRKEDE